MAGETTITVVGNITADPEIRYTQNGVAVSNFTIASTPREFKDGEWKDGEPLFIRATGWKELAENISSSLTKGMRVIAQGRLKQRSYETKEGEKRTVIELEIDEIGPSLKYAVASVSRAGGGNKGGGGNAAAPRAAQAPAAAAQDTWNTTPSWDEETPF